MTLRAGVDLGGTKVQTVIVDEQFSVLGQMRLPTPTVGGPQEVADTIVATIREACHLADTEPDQLASIGVGSPGDVDDANGIVTSARNLPGWEGAFPLARALQDALGPPVSLGNDVNVATMAEFHLGAGQPYSSLLGVFWGTGVGGGVVLDGKLWLGRDAAGEIGHMVVKVGGAKCPCGRHGCMEAYAGRGAMETRARELMKKGEQTDLFVIMEKRGRERLTSGIWARALVRHDPMAVRLVDRAIEALGAGVASAVNLLDVEAVIIGGGLGVRLGDPYRKRIEHAMQPHVFADHRPPRVLLAQLGDLGGAIGAALMASRGGDRGSLSHRGRRPELPVVPATCDGVVHGAEHPQHGADHDQHDADRVEDADAQHEAEQQQEDSEKDHGPMLPSGGGSQACWARSAALCARLPAWYSASASGESTSPSVGCEGTSGSASSTPKRLASTEPSALTFISPKPGSASRFALSSSVEVASVHTRAASPS